MTSFGRNPSSTRLTASAWLQPGNRCAATLGLCLGATISLPACTVIEPQPVVIGQPGVVQSPLAVEPPPVVSVYVAPPLVQPNPILVPWAPPPLLVQAPPALPFVGAVWVGGYWAWQGRWVWSAGYWDRPPRPGYLWMEPYYEHRGNAVVFINGFWASPGVAFVPPPVGLHLSLSAALGGAFGVAPLGPQGVFIPAPPGSVAGLIVPAPLGTPPAVVTGAPAVVRPGMRIVNSNNVTVNHTINNTVVNNVTINNESNIPHLRVEAPASATASRAAFSSDVPARAALAAAARPQTHWEAPLPQSTQSLNLDAPTGHAPMALPPAQAVRTVRAEAAPQSTACPPTLPVATTCLGGQDSLGAYYLIAMPADWNGVLVLHAHGGPQLSAPSPQRGVEDLERWAVMVKAGYAWAGSTFRQGGVAVRAAAEDTERLRGIFLSHVGQPRRTILHGQSWGAGVASKAAEMFTADTVGTRPYDGLLLTSGVLGGGSHAYDFRLDLRVVYEYLCGNHPRPTEPQYALNLGLPAGVHMTRADIAGRAKDCLALNKPAAERSAEQRAKIDTITRVIKIPENSIIAHLTWGTLHFQDITAKRTGGASPFGNMGAAYAGSGDDAALNAAVQRLRADPAAYRQFAYDTDPEGKIPVPVLSTKWISDPTAFVELDARFRSIMQWGGSGERLVQTFTTRGTHSYISDATYTSLMSALLRWVETGAKPTPAGIAAACPSFEARFGAGCSFDPSYQPGPLDTRVPWRERPE